MYARFTDSARQVMQLANQEAQRLNHEYIGTEHLLLALVKKGGSAAVNLLGYFGVESQRVIAEVERFVLRGNAAADIEKAPHTPRAKKVIEYAMLEARDLGHEYVGTEHILLGLLRDEKGFAAQVLMNLGVRLEEVREELRENPERYDDEGSNSHSPQSQAQWRTSDPQSSVCHLDDESKHPGLNNFPDRLRYNDVVPVWQHAVITDA
jgi:ATP-dependent Clp protease ATP-binding subunit ClpC